MIGTNFLGGTCRFEPSCSQYAVEALNEYSVTKAVPLILRRLSKCRPGGSFGEDPLPQEKA